MPVQTLAVPVCLRISGGMVSKDHCSLPVCGSTEKTFPGGACSSSQSEPAQPMMTWLPTTVGGCSSENGKTSLVVFHWLTLSTPLSAKFLHFSPVSASSANSCASIVPR